MSRFVPALHGGVHPGRRPARPPRRTQDSRRDGTIPRLRSRHPVHGASALRSTARRRPCVSAPYLTRPGPDRNGQIPAGKQRSSGTTTARGTGAQKVVVCAPGASTCRYEVHMLRIVQREEARPVPAPLAELTSRTSRLRMHRSVCRRSSVRFGQRLDQVSAAAAARRARRPAERSAARRAAARGRLERTVAARCGIPAARVVATAAPVAHPRHHRPVCASGACNDKKTRSAYALMTRPGSAVELSALSWPAHRSPWIDPQPRTKSAHDRVPRFGDRIVAAAFPASPLLTDSPPPPTAAPCVVACFSFPVVHRLRDRHVLHDTLVTSMTADNDSGRDGPRRPQRSSPLASAGVRPSDPACAGA